MAGGGGCRCGCDDDVVVPVLQRAQEPSGGGRRGHRQKAAWLPLDIIIAEIAARSDPATLVRCAATCRDARRRIAEDPDLRGRLHLHETERFVLPLLHGHMTGIRNYRDWEKTDMYMVDTAAAADATRLVKATFPVGDKTLWNVVPLDSRGGLVLVSGRTNQRLQLLVCNLATRRCLALPPEPAFPDAVPDMGVQYVLLVGGSDGEGAGADAAVAVARRFQVLKAKLVLSRYRSYCRLLVHTFSSEHSAWSSLTKIPIPNLHWSGNRSSRPLVVGDVVHWLCLTDTRSYVLMLHVRAARVNVTALPVSFPRDGKNNLPYDLRHQYLLATATAGGNPVVLVTDTDKVSAWEQSKHTKLWKQQPRVVIESETILGFKDDGLAELIERDRRTWTNGRKHVPDLLWFGERSGAVLLRTHGCCLLWLDLHSKKIVRCFSDRRMSYAQVYCPYEVDVSSWVPTFSSAVTL